MVKIFISYRFSDIPIDELKKLIDPVYNLFKDAGIDVFCNFYLDQYYKDNNHTAKQIMEHCFSELEGSDFVVCLVDTPKYSCGMLLEIGYALANKKSIVVCTREGCEIDTLMAMANKNIKYGSYDELVGKIEYLKRLST